MSGLTEIRWHARAGQGAKTASQVLALALLHSGKSVQSFPEYGPERRGAPSAGVHARFERSDPPHDTVTDPDVVVVLEPSLVHEAAVGEGLPGTGSMLVNAEEAPEELAGLAVRCVPATRLAAARGSRFVNVVMLGAVAAALGEPSLPELQDAAVATLGKKVSAEAVRDAVARDTHGRADKLGAAPAAGVVTPDDAPQPRTGSWRTGLKPSVDVTQCVNCLLCWLYCPRLGRHARGDDVHRLRSRLLQGLRDLRRGVSHRCDRDGRGGHPVTRELLTGGEAVAHAMRQIDPDVVPVYPITPQTPIIQTFAKFVADGRAHTEVVNVESEHLCDERGDRRRAPRAPGR